MARVIFNEEGYKYIDKHNYVLFSEDDTHKKIFDYIDADLSAIPQILEKHISDRMNTETFELMPKPIESNELTEIKTILEASHPYYIFESNKTIVKAIGKYFNQLLVYSVYSSPCEKKLSADTVTYDWYKERFAALIPEPLQIEMLDTGINVTYFFDKYREQCGKSYDLPEDMETFVINVPSKKPVPFISEIWIQNIIANTLYFVLDIDAKGLSELTLQQRLWLCGNIFKTNLSVTENFAFCEENLFDSDSEITEQEQKEWWNGFKIKSFFTSDGKPLSLLENTNIVRNGIPEDFQKPLSFAIEQSKQESTLGPYQSYKIDDVMQLLNLEILNLINYKKMIKRCRNCDKYFIIKNRKTVYCDRKDKSGKTCSVIGSKRSFQKKLEEDEALKLYNRAYKTHYARYQKRKLSKEELDIWREQANDKLNEVRNGSLALEEYQKWLKE